MVCGETVRYSIFIPFFRKRGAIVSKKTEKRREKIPRNEKREPVKETFLVL